MWLEWLRGDLGADHEELMAALLKAHKIAATDNNNVSSSALMLAASVNTPFPQSVAAALMTLGGDIHGPTTQARNTIYHRSRNDVLVDLKRGKRIPGWGNSFYNDSVDPAFEEVDKLIRTKYKFDAGCLDRVSQVIREFKGKDLYPNAAAYTAVTAELIGLPEGLEIILLIVGRLPAWATQWTNQPRY